jgi:Protein of unknown function (DUF1552)
MSFVSYRFARRSFLRSIGGAVGLATMLRNLEASAQGAASPPRVLIVHHPVGTVRADFEPQGTGTTYVTSRLLKPFEDANLRNDMVAFYGLSLGMIGGPGGGGHQKGQVIMATGTDSGFVRPGEYIAQDVTADGPSFDQIFLKNAKALQTNLGYVNVICDDRVDYNPETSCRCLSYSYDRRAIPGGMENTPLFGELSPLQMYTRIFGTMKPGGGTGTATDAELLRAIARRKSVLDYSLRELKRLEAIAPARERPKIEAHTEAIRKIENQLTTQIQSGTVSIPGCASTPPLDVVGGKYDGGIHRDYGNPTATTSDEVIHAQIGQLHMGVIKSAFVCDLVRVATFQWSPGVNHIAFKGFYPGEPNTIYMHHPLSHRVGTGDTEVKGPNRRPEVEYLSRVDEYYATQTAAAMADFKATTDVMGGNLLASTVVPYVTEVGACGHNYSPMPGLIFGGQALGVHGGQYQLLNNRSYNDFWLTVAQALGLSKDALTAEKFLKYTTAPIAGVVG